MSAAEEAVTPYCPKCGSDLARRTIRGCPVESCPGCGGLWFDPAKLRGYLKDRCESPGFAELRTESMPQTTDLECPACWDEGLHRIRARGIELERCPRCRGVFLDSGEIEALVRRSQEQARKLDELVRTQGNRRGVSGGLDGAAALTALSDVAELLIEGVVSLLD